MKITPEHYYTKVALGALLQHRRSHEIDLDVVAALAVHVARSVTLAQSLSDEALEDFLDERRIQL